MKIKDVSIIADALSELYGKDLEGADAWDVSEMVDVINNELNKLEKVKNKLIDKYALKDENNKPKQVKKLINDKEVLTIDFGENTKKVDDEMIDLLDKDITLDVKSLKKDMIFKYKIKPAVIGVLKKYNLIV